MKFSKVPEQYLVLGAVLLCLLPFLEKPFYIDDPLFIWAARWIVKHPWDFYGFPVNWYGIEMPMADVMKNPPLTSYYLAATGSVLGFQEWAVHLALLVPASLASLGLFALARRFCSHPLLASLLAVLTPVFLVSGTTAMCDIWLLAFWVWAVEFWTAGIDEKSLPKVVLSSLLVTLAVLSKYSGLCLLPLLWLYALTNRSWRLTIVGSVLPLLTLALYQWATARLYGHGLLLDGAQYAVDFRFNGESSPLSKILIGLSFMGGCLLPSFLVTPLHWSRRNWLLAALGIVSVAIVTANCPQLQRFLYSQSDGLRWGILVQLSVFVLVGAVGFQLVVSELRRRGKNSLFLCAWVGGVFVFACFLNWAVNARSLITLLPAIAILNVRQLESLPWLDLGKKKWHLGGSLLAGALLSLAVMAADFSQANSARTAAIQINEKYRTLAPRVLFQGHWGFQYYMEELGATALDIQKLDAVASGAVVALPLRNTNLQRLPQTDYRLVDKIELSSSIAITTMNMQMASGFYADVFGPLPFTLGAASPDTYLIVQRIGE